ncbi:MAG: GNAT family N-acetyltransferase [Bacteroidaceae bacterium]|nr:GNAT family N-acetyltransferase [Bacteroidaceae bacterium]MBR3897607.1 GNAT family N-acetyltransferase [Bacteroidaceae bacterium]
MRLIRKPQLSEIESIIKIWLDGNMQAHSFIPSDYWLNHEGYMRGILPVSEVYIYESEKGIVGFVGLEGDYIAGLFVDKFHQSSGIGTKLIEFVKQSHSTLTLAVYEKNGKALQFYLRHHFIVSEERIDPNTNEKELLMKWDRTLSR